MISRTEKAHDNINQFRLPSFGDAETGNGTCFRDPAFASNKTLPIHRWVPWIAGFSSDFVKDAFNRHLGHEGVVLDPFVGVGTTLVEAVLGGHDAWGFEINPYAVLASRTKSNAHLINVEEFRKEAQRFDSFYNQCIGSAYTPARTSPKGFKTRAPFYSPKVMDKVLVIWDFIDSLKQIKLRDMFSLAFAATMVQYSNYSYEPSLGQRVSAGKEEVDDYAVGESILAKLNEMAVDIKWFKENLPKRKGVVRTINDSFFNCRKYMNSECVDLVVTSPPYLNNYHYNRNTRPQLYWLGYATIPNDLKPLEDNNFGKYWQTVRDQDNLALDFTLPSNDLADSLQTLRGLHNEKGVYGGNGWANYAASYFNDCLRFSQGLDYLLKPGGTALVVIGNSVLQGVSIPTDRYLAEIADYTGLEVIEIHIPRATRVGTSIIQSDVRVEKASEKQQLYEAVVELRKK